MSCLRHVELERGEAGGRSIRNSIAIEMMIDNSLDPLAAYSITTEIRGEGRREN